MTSTKFLYYRIFQRMWKQIIKTNIWNLNRYYFFDRCLQIRAGVFSLAPKDIIESLSPNNR